MSHLPIQTLRQTPNIKVKLSLTSLASVLAFILLNSNLSAQKVGVNTDTPLAGLHILSNDGLLVQGEYGMGLLPVTGSGTRMLFNPKTGSFRTGRITDEDGGIYEDWWDFFNVGDYSFATGVNTRAYGYASAAFGHKTQANGLAAFAAGGRSNAAEGNMAFVTGFENTAQSYLEFVIGQEAETYSPNGLTYFDLNDRLFVVGNGLNSGARHNALTILKNGNIGIGISSPQYLLDVYGTGHLQKALIDDSLNINKLKLSTGAGDGYLLQSDANGNAAWVAPSSLFTDDWSTNGNHIYNNNSGNIGIGANNPQDKLHVKGNIRVDQGRINFTNNGFGTFVGNDAGLHDFITQQHANTFVGESAGKENTSGGENTALGGFVFQSNTSGSQNVAVGNGTLSNSISGSYNAALGYNALSSNTTGNENVAVGYYALNYNTTGIGNIGIGDSAGNNNISGSGNVFLGQQAGHDVLGSNNVMIGHLAGYNETGSDKLYIDNSNTALPLIYGDFQNNTVIINDSLQSKFIRMTQGATTGYVLSSDANGNASWTNPSVISPFWTASGNDIYNTNTSNIGIGTSTPNEKLHVAGNMIVGGRIKIENTGYSVFIGNQAGENDDLVDNNSVFIGEAAGQQNVDGNNNIAIGGHALNENVSSYDNIAIGKNTLYNTDSGISNIGIGTGALYSNTMGTENLALGVNALYNSTAANYNIALGGNALGSTSTGSENVALGVFSLTNNLIGNGNIGIGRFSLSGNTNGNLNIGIGPHALETNASGESNVAVGFNSGLNILGNENTIIGSEAGFNTSGSGNIFLGYHAGFDEAGDNKLYIDNSSTSNPLIYGNFTTNKVTINDSLSTQYLIATQSSLVNGILKINAGKISFTNTGQSVFIGDQAGNADDLSNNNSVFIGHQAGKANTIGTNNIAIGAFALDEAANSNYNIAMGQDVLGNSGLTAGYNTGIGNFSLANMTSGSDNIGIGQNAGGSINNGARNVAIGNYSLDADTDGGYNTVVGYEALGSNVNGNNNTVMGHYAGNNVTGSNNVIIGYNAGVSTTGSGNVMLGTEAGGNESGSNKLYIENSNSSSPLIYGDFSSNEVTINDSLTVNKELSVGTSIANSTLEVNGSVAAKFKTPLVAGTNNPDATGMVWRYNSGTGTITLPGAGTCPNRMYVIINQTGTARTISSYRDLTTTPQTTINSSVALWLMSDGSEWWQIK